MSEVGNQPLPDRVKGRSEDDRDGLGGLRRSQCRVRIAGNYDGGRARDCLRRNRSQISDRRGDEELNDDVLSVDIATVGEALKKAVRLELRPRRVEVRNMRHLA